MRTLGRMTIATVAYYVVALVAMHLLRRDLDPLTVPMSAYAIGAYGSLMTTTFFVLGAGLFAAGLGLLQAFPRAGIAKVAFAFMVIASIGVIVAGIFPADWPPPFVSTSAKVHQMAAMIAFPAMTLAPVLFSLKFRSDPRWQDLAAIALALSVGIIACELFLLATASREFMGVGGLVQRLFIAFLLAWMLLVGRRLASVR